MAKRRKPWAKRTGIMLCYPMDEKRLDKIFTRNDWLALLQPKLDGIRARALWDNETECFYLITSEGNIISCLPHIQTCLNDLRKFAAVVGLPQIDEWDGEIYRHGWGMAKINGIASRKAVTPDSYSLQYHIFDTIQLDAPQHTRVLDFSSYSNWLKSALTNGLREECAHLDGCPQLIAECIKFVQTRAIRSHAALHDWYKKFVDDGYEGIILRAPDSYYVRKRSTDCLKFKPKKRDYYLIQRVIEAQDEHGVPLGFCAGFECLCETGVTFSVGTGVGVDRGTATLWLLNGDDLVGKYVEVEYQNLTDTGRPRFGKATRIVSTSLEDRYTKA